MDEQREGVPQVTAQIDMSVGALDQPAPGPESESEEDDDVRRDAA